jgi:hypothetical protein
MENQVDIVCALTEFSNENFPRWVALKRRLSSANFSNTDTGIRIIGEYVLL